MKRIATLLALFCTGLLAASFAFADDGGKGKGKSGSESTATSTTKEHGNKEKCRTVSLKGTAAATSFTITVDKSNRAGRDLNGKPITLKFEGKVNVNAVMCSGDSSATGASAAATSAFQLRNLKVAKPESGEGDG